MSALVIAYLHWSSRGTIYLDMPFNKSDTAGPNLSETIKAYTRAAPRVVRDKDLFWARRSWDLLAGRTHPAAAVLAAVNRSRPQGD
jgi:hypothetical protein